MALGELIFGLSSDGPTPIDDARLIEKSGKARGLGLGPDIANPFPFLLG